MDYELINFFENLLFKLKNNDISKNEKDLLKHVYTIYNTNNLIEDKELYKYIIYGWYVDSIVKNK
jgi:hypothetical protein